VERIGCIGIDLDDLRYYRGIHALPEQTDSPLIFTAAVPRFLAMCERLGARATLFTIGEDLKWQQARSSLKAAVDGGHEVANHSQSHSYALSCMSSDQIDRELATAKEGLEDAVNHAVTGFRGPGYNLSDNLLASLKRTGHRYDTSILPAPAYYLARATIIGGMRCLGRRSASIVGRGRDFFRGRRPFDWTGPAEGLREFPITAAGVLLLPLIGTMLARGGAMDRHLVTACERLPFVNLEFHALDFLDIEEDHLEEGLRVEPALRVPLSLRITRFESALRTLMAGRRTCVLADLL